jgi:predicted ArsR family transcriptional regulator
MKDGYLRGSLIYRLVESDDVLAAFVAAGGSVSDAAARVGLRPSTAKRHLEDLRARSGLTIKQLIYRGRGRPARARPEARPDSQTQTRSPIPPS